MLVAVAHGVEGVADAVALAVGHADEAVGGVVFEVDAAGEPAARGVEIGEDGWERRTHGQGRFGFAIIFNCDADLLLVM